MDSPGWISGCFECVSLMFCLNSILILNFTNAVLSKTTFSSIFVSQEDGVFWHQRNPQARPQGFKNLQFRKKLTTMTRQMTKSRDFRQNYLCDFHLSLGNSQISEEPRDKCRHCLLLQWAWTVCTPLSPQGWQPTPGQFKLSSLTSLKGSILFFRCTSKILF